MPRASGRDTESRPSSSAGYSSSSIATPLLPDAIANSESLVEHSPSTVMALNVSRADSASARCSIAGATCASVAMKPSMVAMFGSIIPEPFAIAPIENEPRGVVTRTACSLGNGSVVMIACAASLPLPCASDEHASWMPATTRSIGSATPITPVEATSTCSGSQPSALATSSVIRRALASPSSPVQAFAQPLFTTMAQPVPRVTSRCRFETSTGAACARLVVNRPAIDANVSTARTARSSAPAFALMPQCSAADRNPVGAVMPPSIGAIDVCRVTAMRSAMQGGQRDAAVARPFERAHDGVLPAAPELAAGVAVGDDLLGQPLVRNDREPEMDEVAGGVREGAQLLEAGRLGAAHEPVHDSPADAAAACVAPDDHRPDFRDRAAQGRQLRAREDLVILDRDDEAVCMDEDFAKLAREQLAFCQLLVYQLVDRVGLGG